LITINNHQMHALPSERQEAASDCAVVRLSLNDVRLPEKKGVFLKVIGVAATLSYIYKADSLSLVRVDGDQRSPSTRT
jgi:hypothetical protein